MQAILTGVKRRDEIVAKFAKASGAQCVTEWNGGPVIVMGNLQGCDEIQMKCRATGIPYIYIDHGYFSRGYDRGVFRVCVNNYHCTDWRNSDRKWHGKLKDWRNGNHIVVIPPAELVQKIYNCAAWESKITKKLSGLTDRKVIVKRKGIGDLQEILNKAHAIVSYGSVADVEAVMSGIPAFTSEYSPAVPVALQDMKQIENPIYPDRGEWLNSLAASQWHKDEFAACWERIKPLLPL